MERTVLHCDLNNFFASVSLLKAPNFINEPVAVCGDEESRHGIILAKNEIAKKFGVKTAETIWEAKLKCPGLILLPSDYAEYKKYSRMAREIYSRYTDLIEPFGIDECWLDVTDSHRLFGDGVTVANRIRRDIKRELGLTISVGVSFNKVFAKLGSDMKKPDGLTVITRENFKDVVWRLPAEDLLFVGQNTKKRLSSTGIFTIGDIALCDENTLKRLLGKAGTELKNYSLGLDDSPVKPENYVRIPKSVGRSETGKTDFCNEAQVWEAFILFSEEISRELKRFGLFATGVQIHLRTAELKVREISAKLKSPTDSAIILARAGMELFKENCDFSVPYRSVGIRAINIRDDILAEQQDMFGESKLSEKEKSVEEKMFEIQDKYGKGLIHRGSVKMN